MFLCPLWAVPLIPLVGLVAALTGELGLQIGYAAVLMLCFAYLLDDVLKRKIRVEKDWLFFGARSFNLQELVSVCAVHKREHVFPEILELTFANQQVLALRTQRFKTHELRCLVRLIERRVPQCRVDPMLAGALKSRKLIVRRKSWPDGRVEIPYRSSNLARSLVSSFFTTAERWTRMGPLLGLAICVPFWATFVTVDYILGARFGHTDRSLTTGLQDVMVETSRLSSSILQSGLRASSEAVAGFLTNPITGLASGVFILIVVYQLLKALCRPTSLLVSSDGIALQLTVAGTPIPLEQVRWNELAAASLIKPQKGSHSRTWVVRLQKTDKSAVDLTLSALEPEDRKHILNALEQHAPHCRIDPELGESLLPKQERSYTELWLQSLSSPRERTSLEPLAPGQYLQTQRYEVLRRLGIGGQGMAYLAIDNLHPASAQVVLKESILPVFADVTVREQAVQRFEQEARILGRLKHSGIVELLDVFIEDHRGYLVLEHVDGRNLRQVIEADGPLPEERARQLAALMCDILSYLHANGVIHRDFTPENLMLTAGGELRLIDFNVAQAMESGATGTIVGKHAYLPPEQFRGKPTQQSDLYAMGATLYFLLTGRDPEPITQLSPAEQGCDVSEEFDGLIKHLTALQCERRFQSADLVKQALSACTTSDTGGCTISLSARETETAVEARS